MNFVFRKYEQKWIARWRELNYICDSRTSRDASNFEIQLQNAFQSENQRFRSNFFPQLRKIQGSLRSGLVSVGPRYALFFYLLRCRWSVRFVEWCTTSGDNMLNAELISHHILPQCCSWRLQLKRYFSSAVVEKLMSSFKLIRILLLQWLFAHCFSGAADLGWGVLRTPTSPFALKGECHKFVEVGGPYGQIWRFQHFTWRWLCVVARGLSFHCTSEKAQDSDLDWYLKLQILRIWAEMIEELSCTN